MTRNRTAVITGAGSKRGIGRAVALHLARDGWNVAILDINGHLAEDAAAEVASTTGVQARGYQVDVIDQASIAAAIERVTANLPPVEGLVNIAGVSAPFRFLEITPDEWDRVFDINVKGTFLVTQAVLPLLLAQGRGRIVNMSSVTAVQGGGMFGGPHYSASKAAVLGLTRALARELAPTTITVNAVAPGLTDTDITSGKFPPEREAAIMATVPLHRRATIEEVASAFAYLMSDDAAFITGTTLDVNGGVHIN
jgi:2-hydroxycyclohexanecarboxyl-CoA dehydrogenase